MGIEWGSQEMIDAYRRHDAVSLAGLIAKREISAAEVLEATIARAEQIDAFAACSTAPIRCCTCGAVDMKMSSPRALLMS
jgi:Asp-tRNA(Asn)/Glu-tRNA(Gln) amidotransferase A subunit family amidase